MKLGIIGSGQLGLMMILEGKKLGVEFLVIDKSKDGPASRIADKAYDYEEFKDFVDSSDYVTYEFEHVDERVLNYAKEQEKLRPGLLAVELKRDRSREKTFLRENGLPVGEFEVAENADAAIKSAKEYGDAVIKSAFGGYDGKGQYLVKDGLLEDDLPEGKYVVEKFVKFDMEASVIGARDPKGNTAFFDSSLNVNYKGMLYYNAAPIEDSGMRDIVKSLMEKLSYVGVMGVEFFIKDGKPYINEFAPRVHNSGHHTILGSSISQFEQHVRAVCGIPLADPELYRPSGILNLVGISLDEKMRDKILLTPETQVYWYGKNGIRKRRKVGHINITAKTYVELLEKIKTLSSTVYGSELDNFFSY
jgi:5-(carboxyamino)imidazole ribonucleotide synthase